MPRLPACPVNAMNLLVTVLASVSVLAVAAVIYLSICLYRKEAELKAVSLRLTARPDAFSSGSSSEPVTVTDQFLYDRCCRYMVERRPYLVTTYSLQDLANAMYTNRYYLSKIINRFSGKNFRAYVNYYRVMYAMEKFRENMSLRVSDLSQMSGFNTESSFLDSFKSVMGQTPSLWCAKMKSKYKNY